MKNKQSNLLLNRELIYSVITLAALLVSILVITWAILTQQFELRKYAANPEPTCNGLSTSPATGVKPLEVTLTCTGSGINSDVLAAEFYFGDGGHERIEKNVGVFGSYTTSHTYKQDGLYAAFCRVKDNNDQFSAVPDSCRKTIEVLRPAKQAISSSKKGDVLVTITPTPLPTDTPTPTPQPTIEPTETPKEEPTFSFLRNIPIWLIILFIVSLVAYILMALRKKSPPPPPMPSEESTPSSEESPPINP